MEEVGFFFLFFRGKNRCFLPAPGPVFPAPRTCAEPRFNVQLQVCIFCAIRTRHPSATPPPRKGLYPTSLSCSSHPAWAAATSLLAPLPKHLFSLCIQTHSHTHTQWLHNAVCIEYKALTLKAPGHGSSCARHVCDLHSLDAT